jgi:hypothetical protein
MSCNVLLHDCTRHIFAPSTYRVATEELEKKCARVHPEKSSCIVPHDIVPTLLDESWDLVHIVTGARILGASLVIDFSISHRPPASQNIN